MADLTQPYDDLAAHYDQIFENWEVTIARQAKVLVEILHDECADSQSTRVLDCACGIGTQSLGLAMQGFDVMGCDVSYRAIQRARSEASKRGLSIPFLVANMVELSAVPDSSFDAVICMDNSLPTWKPMNSRGRLPNRYMENLSQEVPSLAAFATTIDLLWKGRQHKARASIRMAQEGALFFKSGIGWMSGAIVSICT